MGQAASSIEVLGDVYGFDQGGVNNVTNISFTVGLTAGNQPMDMARMRVTLTTGTGRDILQLHNTTGAEHGLVGQGNWSVTRIFDPVPSAELKNDLVLNPNEKFQITVRPSAANIIPPDQRFTISMQPEVGAMTTVVRTTPADIKAVNVLR